MCPLPLESTPSFGCQAGPSPPAPSPASTFNFAPGSKMSSSARATPASSKHARTQFPPRMVPLLSGLLPSVHVQGDARNAVLDQLDVARPLVEADADSLRRPARLLDLVAANGHALRLALHVHRDAVLGSA